MKPFVLLASRPQTEIADDEYQSFLRLGNLEPEQLIRIRLDEYPLSEFDIDLDAISGFMVGGSPFSASTPADEKTALQHRVEKDLFELLDTLVPMDFPFLGACYGVGTLGVHQAAIINSTYSEEISAPTISLTEEGKKDPLLEGCPTEFDAYVGHKEACYRLPEHAVLLATSSRCPVQMFRIGRNMYGTQFHPELDWQSLVKRINAYQYAGYYPAEEKERIIDGCRGADVSAANTIIKKFVQRYAR
ncbi:MAG: glutamine amidotransferase [Actinomycetaceae bacterium]|nr:glutamine amidotransferase [Actinomycetaceae bacterium]